MTSAFEPQIDNVAGTGPDASRREFLGLVGAGALGAAAAVATSAAPSAARAQNLSNGDANFYTSDQVTSRKVTFTSQYRMRVGGNLVIPKALDRNRRHPALVVGHPMGAVKEQSANLYAIKMAEQGFITLAIDLPFWGESEGEPRNLVAPDHYAEAFSAAVDFLGTQPLVERARIGAIGICGSGSFVISAAKTDSRIRAVATLSMYDMGSVNRSGLNQSLTVEQRKALIAAAADLRWAEFEGAPVAVAGGTDLVLTASTHPIQREFYDFYRTPRGAFTPAGASDQHTTKPTVSSNTRFMNFYPFNDIETISPRPMLFISGDQAHSREFSEDAYRRAAEPKQLVWVRGAGHVDLYDRVDLIPFAKLSAFFDQHLSA